MSSKKKVSKAEVETITLPPPIRKSYFLFSPDTHASSAMYVSNRVFITHTEDAYVEIVDTGNGYRVQDVSPVGGTKVYDLDYAVMADLFAALKIFHHNADKKNAEYWTIFEGEKI